MTAAPDGGHSPCFRSLSIHRSARAPSARGRCSRRARRQASGRGNRRHGALERPASEASRRGEPEPVPRVATFDEEHFRPGGIAQHCRGMGHRVLPDEDLDLRSGQVHAFEAILRTAGTDGQALAGEVELLDGGALPRSLRRRTSALGSCRRPRWAPRLVSPGSPCPGGRGCYLPAGLQAEKPWWTPGLCPPFPRAPSWARALMWCLA